MKKFKFIGRKYSTEKTFYNWDSKKEFFFYKEIETREFPAMEFKSLNHAELWFLENHPEYYFGCNVCGVGNTDFSMVAVPSYYEELVNTNDRNFIIDGIKKSLMEKINGWEISRFFICALSRILYRKYNNLV